MGMAMGMPIKRVLETLVEMEIKYCQQFFTRDHMVLLHLSLFADVVQYWEKIQNEMLKTISL
jgi:hypothetical protein